MPFTSQKALVTHSVTQEFPHLVRTKSHVVPVKSIGHQPAISILFGRTTHKRDLNIYFHFFAI